MREQQKKAFEQLTETRNRAAADLASADQKKADFLLRNQKDIVASRNAIAQLSGNFDVRRLAACTHGDKDVFYILWMDDLRKMPILSRMISKTTAHFLHY